LAPLVINPLSAMRLIGGSISQGALKSPYSLTSREIAVLEWVARGKSAWEIGEILHITKRTVDAHIHCAVLQDGRRQ
jgi:DNA-binding CsgD family transcriptional regulator